MTSDHPIDALGSQSPDPGRHELGAERVRLQKFLARAGIASRRASEELIAAGCVTVNGEVVTELGSKVDPVADAVAVDGRAVELADGHHTIMLHKPAGFATSMKAQPQSDLPIVADLVPTDRFPGLFPVGRLDADTTGLLLFTTDGELGNALLHPSRHVPKTYRARVDGAVSQAAAERLRKGIELDDGPTQPAVVEFANSPDDVRITIHEGRKRQVKRMFATIGHPVLELHRERFGALELGDLKPGEWRELSEDEIEAIKSSR